MILCFHNGLHVQSLGKYTLNFYLNFCSCWLYFTYFILVSSWHITGYKCKSTRQMLTTVYNITLRNKYLNNYVKQRRETNKGLSRLNLVFKWKWDQRKVDTSCHISQWVLFTEIDYIFHWYNINENCLICFYGPAAKGLTL